MGSNRQSHLSGCLTTCIWVSNPGLVSLYHTLLITAMTGPLSQRMLSSFSGTQGHVFIQSCLKSESLDPGQGVGLAGLSRLQVRLVIPSSLETGTHRSVWHLRDEETSSKNVSSSDFCSIRGHSSTPSGIPIPLSASTAPSLWPLAPLVSHSCLLF